MDTSTARHRWLMVAAAVIIVGGLIVGYYARRHPPGPVHTGGRWPCELRYELGWNGLSCASFDVRLEQSSYLGKKSLKLSYSGETLPVIDWAWQYHAAGFTYLEPGSALPRYSYRHTRVNDERKTIFARFMRAEGKIRTVSLEEGGDRESFTAQCSPGLDLQGAFLYLGRIEWKSGETRTLEVVDEDERYEVVVRRLGTETINVEGGSFDTVKVDLSLQDTGESDNDDGKSTSEKYRTIHVWFSRNAPRVPVKMRSKVFVGAVGAELTSSCCGEDCSNPEADDGD